MACERSEAWFAEWNEQRATKLKDMLEKSIAGINKHADTLKELLSDSGGEVEKEHCKGMENNGCLRDLAQRLRSANLSITRAKVTSPDHSASC